MILCISQHIYQVILTLPTCYLRKESCSAAEMGSFQSKPTPADRAVITRLRALELESKRELNDEGFVEVDGTETEAEACLNEKTLDALRLLPTTLDIGKLDDWQTKLLQDPKNRCCFSLSRLITIPSPHTDNEARRIDSLYRPFPLPILEMSCLPAQPKLPINKSTTSRSRLRAPPSPTSEAVGDAGSSPRPTSFE